MRARRRVGSPSLTGANPGLAPAGFTPFVCSASAGESARRTEPLTRVRLSSGNARRACPMKLSDEDRDRLALHTAFAVHQIARWIAVRDDVPKDIRDRLRGHITALE